MSPIRFMIVAGEPSGDLLAAELVSALHEELQPLGEPAPVFFGAGGPRMADAGVDLAFDFTQDAVVGLSDALRKYATFRRRMRHLLALAADRKPHAILCVDFSGFNLRFADRIRSIIREDPERFQNWSPRIVQYVSPQVWASRPKRASRLERDYDLLLSIFSFEKEWYAKRAPRLQIAFVGHPIVDRYAHFERPERGSDRPLTVLLPGSRIGELRRHIPIMAEAAKLLAGLTEVRMILPNAGLAELANTLLGSTGSLRVQVAGLPDTLACADIAVAATGTVTLECAYFGVPTVAMYKTSWSTYQIGKRLITVKYLSMPNLLANEAVFPEFIQGQATPRAIAQAVADLLRSPEQQAGIKNKLKDVVRQLGEPGAARRAARAVVSLLNTRNA